MSTTRIRRMLLGNTGLWAVVLCCLAAGACFRSSDPTKVKCADDKNCPGGFTCSKQIGTCVSGKQQPLDGGSAGSDGSTKPQSGGGAGGSSSDGGGSGGSKIGIDGSSDIPITSAPSCTVDTDCSTGHCVDGVCCDSACDGQCESCKEAGSVGICTAVKGDPVAPRAACGGTGSCKGQCDGNSGKTCIYPGDSTVCTAAKCESGKVTTASLCNSAGACSTSTSSTCPNSQCATDGSAKCATACTPTSCAAGSYCDTTGACLPAQAASSSCSSGQQCTSGYCVDGVCCDSKCDGQCQSCRETGSVGTCKAIKGDPITTRTACGGTGICKGQCDGTGTACAYPTDSTVCTQAACTAGKATSASVCNGSGACTTATTNQCPSNACGTDGKCTGSCTPSSCLTGTYCDSTGACTKTLDNGAKCSSAGQCTSGNCVDGVCCDGKCDGTCESCSTGTCSFTSTPRTSCTGTGKCAGYCDKANTKTCTYPGSSTTCSDQSCSGGVRTNPSLCDGKGVCPTATTTNCDTKLCSGSDCSGSCTSTSCGAGMYCAGTTCASVKNQGDSCSADAECLTNHCVDGYCCESACAGACTICSATRGKCTNTTNARVGKACGSTGQCTSSCTGSSPDCSYTSTSCGSATCLTSTTLQQPGTCNSQGTCVQSTQSCTACVNKACADCQPNDKKCGTTQPQKCDSSGHWVNDTVCGTGYTCSGAGVCSCNPDCTNKCGGAGNGCGGTCSGSCGSGQACNAGTCCTPATQAAACGSRNCGNAPNGDGCGNPMTCGTCIAGQNCNGGAGKCQCDLGTLTACNTCTGWNFDSCTNAGLANITFSVSTDATPFSAKPNPSGAGCVAGSGTFDVTSGGIGFTATLCSSTRVSAFSAQMYVEGDSLGFTEGALWVGGGMVPQKIFVDTTPYQWNTIALTLDIPQSGSNAQFSFNFSTAGGSAKVYFDNVLFQ